jgi:uncharacterized membrane protein YciS (DUF1049 family)
MREFVYYVAQTMPHLFALLVVIFSITFRLCVAMFLFLLIYMHYYRVLNTEVFRRLQEQGLHEKLFSAIMHFKK